jgi:hypothetical protein
MKPSRVTAVLLLGQTALPAEIDGRCGMAGEVEVMQLQDAGLSETGLAVVHVDGVKSVAVRRPVHLLDVPVRLGENRSRFAAVQIVQQNDRLDLIVEVVAQAALMDGDGVAAVGRDGQLVDAILIFGQPRHPPLSPPEMGGGGGGLNAEQPYRRFVRFILDDDGIVFFVLERAGAQGRRLLSGEDQRIGTGPIEMEDVGRPFGQRPRFAAAGVYEPDLIAGVVIRRMFSRLRTRAEESKSLPIGRPARMEAILGAARENGFAPRGQFKTHQVADGFAALLVGHVMDPDGPAAIR